MPARKLYTQTFTVTITDSNRFLHAALNSYLNSTTENGGPFGEDLDFSIDAASEVKAIEVPNPHAARDTKLLELKGWLYGEHLKKEAGLPSEWDQGTWGAVTACGTSACIAGKTVLEAGGRFCDAEGDFPTIDLRPGGRRAFDWVKTPDGRVESIRNEASTILGLTPNEESVLFAGHNTYPMASAIIDAIIAGEDVYDARHRAEYERH